MLDIATEKEKTEKIYTIRLRGRLDAVTAEDFIAFYEDMIRAGHRFFIFDATMLEFVSSAGISALVRFVRKIEPLGGRAAITDLNQEIRLLLEFFGISEHMPAFPSTSRATKYLTDFIQKDRSRLSLEKEEPEEVAYYGTRRSTFVHEATPGTPPEKNADRSADLPSVDAFPDLEHQSATWKESGVPPTGEVPPSPPPEGEPEVPTPAAEPQATGAPQARTPGTSSTPPAPSPSPSPTPPPTPTPTPQQESHMEGHSTDQGEGIDLGSYLDESLEHSSRSKEDDEEIQISTSGRDTDFVSVGSGGIEKPSASKQGRSFFDEDRVEEEFHDHQGDDGRGYKLIQCEQCGMNLRVHHTGRHMCPSCGIEFHIKKSGDVSYFEKL